MFRHPAFNFWFVSALLCWLGLFYHFNDLQFLFDHWFYPVIMIAGAFVAGSTPEGGGAVAFPVLNIFLQIDRVMARDFSLMIQSIGMTSASIYILSHSHDRRLFKPLLWMIPCCFVGFVIGMQGLQQLPVTVIQALFLSLITAFAVVYSLGQHRGCHSYLRAPKGLEWPALLLVLLAGGACASLFGTGADIIVYTLLVTRFRLKEKLATQLAILLMAAMSILGFAYRGLYEQTLTPYQIQTWLCAYPVVLLMAPLGALVLAKVNKELMLRAVAILNIGQLAYFVLYNPSTEKWLWASAFMLILTSAFALAMRQLAQQKTAVLTTPPPTPN